MNPKLYMHMGWPKTGTTTIQHFLYSNRDALRRNGYCYPSKHIVDESVFNYKYENHIFAVQNFHGQWNRWMALEDWTFYRKNILEEMLAAQCPANILSAEMFVYEHSDNIEFWQKDFEVTGIYYLRNYFDWLVSQQKEQIKYFLTPDVFVYDRISNYPIVACVRHHRRVLGENNCIFIDYDKEKGDLLNNFLDTVGITFHQDLIYPEPENITPLDARLIFFYQLSFAPFSRFEFRQIRRELNDMDLSEFSGFRSNTLPESIYNLDETAVKAIKFQGKLLGDDEWYDKTIARGEELRKIPYRDLPPEIQNYIFENLSSESRALITSWLPAAANAKNNAPFLPPMKNFYDYRDQVWPLYAKYCMMMYER